VRRVLRWPNELPVCETFPVNLSFRHNSWYRSSCHVEPMNEEDRLRRWSDKIKQSSSQVVT